MRSWQIEWLYSDNVCGLFVKKQKVSRLMSAYQIFRSALLGFQNENWIEGGITLCDELATEELSLENLQKHYSVVFVDISGYFNICYSVMRETFLTVRFISC
ncbi:nucleolar protein 6 [Trichonephila clavata]|uniref:Nucleolar protein 6 n=1 Tax=Trichonephila clavata TaxID=2740835 RepID=A0A8X6LGN8_TRICU|nr:nucleolar protein 6 [Trichonephila clavata]